MPVFPVYMSKGPYRKEKEVCVDDQKIIDLYWLRSENAISETANKYGGYCHSIAFHILHDREDSEECVNDTFFSAWNTIPPQRPGKLPAFLGTITRNLSLNKWERYTAEKRGYGQVPLALEELHDCIPTSENVEQIADDLALTDVLNRFLSLLSKDQRKVFMCRYWYMDTIEEIADSFSMSASAVKMSLLRSRNKLKLLLEEEGFTL